MKGYRVNSRAIAGYTVWATLIAWFVSPASPTWPESLVAGPMAIVAAFLTSAAGGEGK